MIFVYIGLYLITLAVLWGFFIVAKIHSYKFKHFSDYIVPITVTLFVFLLVLSLLGFVMLFFLGNPKNTIQIDRTVDTSPIEENYY